jgi:hypothetical protein
MPARYPRRFTLLLPSRLRPDSNVEAHLANVCGIIHTLAIGTDLAFTTDILNDKAICEDSILMDSVELEVELKMLTREEAERREEEELYWRENE